MVLDKKILGEYLKNIKESITEDNVVIHCNTLRNLLKQVEDAKAGDARNPFNGDPELRELVISKLQELIDLTAMQKKLLSNPEARDAFYGDIRVLLNVVR